MTNVAQTINCIHSLFLAEGDKFVRLPPYYVFEMYRGHMSARQAGIEIRCEELKVHTAGGPVTMAGLSGSASTKGKTATVTLTNPSLDSPRAAVVKLASGTITEGRGQLLTHEDMTAGNTFAHPDTVKLAPFTVNIRNNRAEISIPPRAVVALELKIS
jgi:alpha-L-arabinofuranosidase